MKNGRKTMYIVKGLFYGDEGKGQTVSNIARKILKNTTPDKCVGLRLNGNANAAHTVHHEGKVFIYRQLSSASHFGFPTVFHPRFRVDLIALDLEIERFFETFGFYPKVHINNYTVLTSQIHVEKSAKRNSCCRSGLMEVEQDLEDDCSIFAWDKLKDAYLRTFDEDPDEDSETSRCLYELEQIAKHHKSNIDPKELFQVYMYIMKKHHDKHIFTYCHSIMECADFVIAEASQGVMLDESLWDEKTYPYTTWSHTKGDTSYIFEDDRLISRNSLAKWINSDIKHIGVCRWYLTRHGDGPFKTENQQPYFVSTYETNTFNDAQGVFRVGAFDLELLRKSISIAEVDAIVITNTGYSSYGNNIPNYYWALHEENVFSSIRKNFSDINVGFSHIDGYITGIEL